MRQKRVKALKDMAALFYQMQNPNLPKKSLRTIYKELKVVHKTKLKSG